MWHVLEIRYAGHGMWGVSLMGEHNGVEECLQAFLPSRADACEWARLRIAELNSQVTH